jgi:hypothetical protein
MKKNHKSKYSTRRLVLGVQTIRELNNANLTADATGVVGGILGSAAYGRDRVLYMSCLVNKCGGNN